MGVLEERQVADENWRRRVDERLDQHMERLDAGDARMSAIEEKLDSNNAMTASTQAMATRIEGNTKHIVQVVQNVTGFRNVTKWAMGLLIQVSVVIIAAGIVYWFLKTGDLPRKV